MAFDFDPDAFLVDLRKNDPCRRRFANPANPANGQKQPGIRMQSAPARFATFAKFAEGLPPEPEVEGEPETDKERGFATFAGFAGDLPPEPKVDGSTDGLTEASGADARRSANPAKVANGGIHVQLNAALVRELWPTESARTFLIDTSIRAKKHVLEQVPEKVDPAVWRAAVVGLSGFLAGRTVRRAYDEQPLIVLKC